MKYCHNDLAFQVEFFWVAVEYFSAIETMTFFLMFPVDITAREGDKNHVSFLKNDMSNV